MNRDQSLRAQRLVFYEDDVQRLDAELDTFLELSKARCVLLVDREGHLVTRRGEAPTSSIESIAALIAGSFAATREMARLLGEAEFSVLFHQGDRDSIQLQLIGERTLLAALFDSRATLGMVRFYAQETAGRLEAILTAAAAQDREVGLSEGFEAAAQDLLDELL